MQEEQNIVFNIFELSRSPISEPISNVLSDDPLTLDPLFSELGLVTSLIACSRLNHASCILESERMEISLYVRDGTAGSLTTFFAAVVTLLITQYNIIKKCLASYEDLVEDLGQAIDFNFKDEPRLLVLIRYQLHLENRAVTSLCSDSISQELSPLSHGQTSRPPCIQLRRAMPVCRARTGSSLA